MHNIITIKELVQHILSFIPRKIIVPCALTCKHFHNAITIDYNQERVAINSDMFSLIRIPYSLIVVANISIRNNNIVMFEYLLKKHKFDFRDIEGLYRSIGYSGNEILLDKIMGKSFPELDMKIGICEGSHTNLIDKYDLYNNYFCVKEIYKTNVDKQKIDTIVSDKYMKFELDIFTTEGYCATGTLINVKSYIQQIIDSNLIKDYTYYIYRGLIHGNNYDLVVWLDKMYKFPCNENYLMKDLIVKNNFKIFTYLISSLNNMFCNGRIKFITFDFLHHSEVNYANLAYFCIEYRRLDMLEFLMENIIFNKFRYQEFLAKAEILSFNDVKNLLQKNSHLFEVYDEGDY